MRLFNFYVPLTTVNNASYAFSTDLTEEFHSFVLRSTVYRTDSIWLNELFNDVRGKNYGNKLRTCRLFKQNISSEHYLSCINEEQRRLLTKFWISAHNLEIERGRYRGLHVEDRICNLCKAGVEDEVHFFLCCPVLQATRSVFIQKINDEYQNFKTLDTQLKIYMVNVFRR